MAKQYTVRCKPSSAGPFKTTLWDVSSTLPVQVTANELLVTAATDYELRADYPNSDAGVNGFRIHIAPTSNDIQKVIGNDSPSLSFTNLCQSAAPVDLKLEARAPGGPYPMGSKPIIRNRPVSPPPYNVALLGMLLLIIVIVVLVVWYVLNP